MTFQQQIERERKQAKRVLGDPGRWHLSYLVMCKNFLDRFGKK